MWNRGWMVLLALGLAAGACLAQDAQTQQAKAEKPRPSFYRLDFVIKEFDGGHVVNSRSYFTLVETGSNSGSFIRTGVRIPIGTPEHPDRQDVGVRIDCRQAREIGDELALEVTADITALPQDANSQSPLIVRQNVWSAGVLIPIKKPSVIFSSDSTTSKSQMQVEVTATPVQ